MPQGSFQYGDILRTISGPVSGFTGMYVRDRQMHDTLNFLVLKTAIGGDIMAVLSECRLALDDETAAYMGGVMQNI